MLIQLLVGGIVSVVNITIHSLVMSAVVRVSRHMGAKTTHPSLRLTSVMIVTVLVLMTAHIVEVLVWSFAYFLTNAAPAGSHLLYFAFVNYTTLGYGEIIPVKEWELLGPFAAMNGVILFGWSTAVIFAVLQRTMETAESEPPQ
jgi:ion channel